MTMGTPAKIFISYATKDGAEAAASLRRDFEARGFTIWQDVAALKGEVPIQEFPDIESIPEHRPLRQASGAGSGIPQRAALLWLYVNFGSTVAGPDLVVLTPLRRRIGQ